MALTNLKTVLQSTEARALNWRMSLDSWASDQEIRADKVKIFRDYAEGAHDAKLTSHMKEMLRIGESDFDRFNDNYMDIIIQTPVDRLKINGFKTDNDKADRWVADLLEINRFDGTQVDVTEAALRDADTYVLVSWDNELKRVHLSHESAWDGTRGMLVVHDPMNRVNLGIKSWQEQLGSVTRVNLYFADHIEYYIGQGEGALSPYTPEGFSPRTPFLLTGDPIGCPVVHFPNRGTSYDAYGLSEIENAIPLQNALNRTLYSMVMTAELTGFGIRKAIGFTPPAELTPGMWLTISGNGPLTPDQKVEVGMLEQGEITPYIQQAQWLTSEIGKITRTPAPEFMGADTASGESLKQREIGLIGKCKRFQIKAGNRWEDVIKLAWRVQAAFGNRPPEFTTISAQWDEVELRNDSEVVANAKVLAEMGYAEEALRQMAPVFHWTEQDIQRIMAAKLAADEQKLTALAGNLPTFSAATFGLPSNGNGNRITEGA